MKEKCKTCAKRFANRHGLAIHAYRMHGKRDDTRKFNPCPALPPYENFSTYANVTVLSVADGPGLAAYTANVYARPDRVVAVIAKALREAFPKNGK